MTASEKSFRFAGHNRNAFQSRSLRVENFDRIRAGVTLHEAKRYDDGFTRNLGLAEGRDTFLEHADNRESQLADSNIFSHWADARKNGTCEFLCHKAGFVLRPHIVVIEVTAGYHQKMAYPLKAFGDRYQGYRTFNTAGDNGHLEIVRSCSFDYVRYFAAYRLDIRQRNLIAQSGCLCTDSPQFPVDEVGSSCFNLRDDIVSSSKRNRDDQNDARTANHNT